MKKEWIKRSELLYSFNVDEKEVGTMEIKFNKLSNKAICTVNGKSFEIKRTGFWKTNMEITDNQGLVILKASPEKWYGTRLVIDYKNKEYKLVFRNNPLAEYAVMENEKVLSAYGLATEKKELAVKNTNDPNADLIFDFLLWYLFFPVAVESIGDVSFLLLTTAS